MERYDVIVIGAGLGGSAAALSLARKGYDVLLLEKARVPGHRNMTGGVFSLRYISGYGLADLIPDLTEAPLERRIKEHSIHALSKPEADRKTYRIYTIDSRSLWMKTGIIPDPYTGHDYSVLRARFDRWLADKATGAGTMMATECTVESLLRKDGRVVGVRTADEELSADMVIDASGVTSSFPVQLGLRARLGPEAYFLGLKHVYHLGSKVIEERFRLREGEGVAQFYLGYFMKGVKGGAFIYTNRDSLSVGMVVELDSFIENCDQDIELGKPLDLLEEFEEHPLIAGYLDGASLLEYSAHTVPKGTHCMLRQPYYDGFLAVGDALGSFVKIGPMLDGMRLAIATGMMAAEVFHLAKGREDFSSKTLSYYRRLLKPVYRDMRRSKIDSRLFANELTYGAMPSILTSLPFGSKEVTSNLRAREPDARDAIQRIQTRTGLLTYNEDKEYSHIQVDLGFCSQHSTKPWVPACPLNCYTLVLDKGVFTSYRDLFIINLRRLKEKYGREDEGVRLEADLMTRQDIKRGGVRFDHVACVGCGTCGIIGPPEAVSFGPERRGHGVQYSYG